MFFFLTVVAGLYWKAAESRRENRRKAKGFFKIGSGVHPHPPRGQGAVGVRLLIPGRYLAPGGLWIGSRCHGKGGLRGLGGLGVEKVYRWGFPAGACPLRVRSR